MSTVKRQSAVYQMSWGIALFTLVVAGLAMVVEQDRSAWLLVASISLLLAEVLIYLMWQFYIASSDYIIQLQRVSLFLMCYAVVELLSTSELLDLAVSVVAIVAWSRLYAVSGIISLNQLFQPSQNNRIRAQQRVVLLIILRLLVEPVIGGVYLFIYRLAPDALYEQELIVSISAFIVAYMARYSLVFHEESFRTQ